MGDYRIDWERRRILPVTGTLSHCVHGSRLHEFCADCPLELEGLARYEGDAA